MTTPAGAVTANGRLQIIHLDVGQGDGAVIITPLGQVVMIDEGRPATPAMGVTVLAQLQALGVTHVDHHFASHYHSDHIGNFDAIFDAGSCHLDYGWDRAGSYTTAAYTNYVNTLGAKRRTMVEEPGHHARLALGAPGHDQVRGPGGARDHRPPTRTR